MEALIVPIILLFSGFVISDGAGGIVPTRTDTEYHSSYEITEMMMDMEVPGFSEFSTADELLGTRDIPGEREIPILLVEREDSVDRPWVMLIGAHHGDEPDSAEAVLHFAKFIHSGIMSSDPFVLDIVNRTNMAILPVVNPFGLDQGTRFDENGEDPNRDYPFMAETEVPGSDGIPLTTAGAQTIHDLSRMFPFSLALSFHTGSMGIFTVWGADGLPEDTPDKKCIHDIGEVLSKASGMNMVHGPANSFQGVSYLRGAFDDHLYGASVLPDRLYSSSHVLPYCTATATIEMGVFKGRDASRLGNISGLMDPGGPADGTVPAGVRMCLAACMCAAPKLEVYHELRDDELSLWARINGALNVDHISASVRTDNKTEITAIPTERSSDSIFPGSTFGCVIDVGGMNGTAMVTMTARIDEQWAVYEPGGEPDISPRSLLAQSRKDKNGELTWSFNIDLGGSTVEEPRSDVNLSILSAPSRAPIGTEQEIQVNIEAGDMQDALFTIISDVNGISTSISYAGSELEEGASSYSFYLPIEAGTADVEVILTLDGMNYTSSTSIEVYPNIHIMNYIRDTMDEETVHIYVGIDGSSGPTTVFYGASRTPYLGWDDEGWVIEPTVDIAPSYGPRILDVDLGSVGGPLYFRVCNFPGARESIQFFDQDIQCLSSEIAVRSEDERIIAGPALILYTGNGIDEPDPGRINYTLEIRTDPGETVMRTMQWVHREWMSDQDLAILNEQALLLEVDPDELTGGWMLEYEPDREPDKVHVIGTIVGKVALDLTEGGKEVNLTASGSLVLREDDGGDDDKDNSIPWALIIFLFVAGVMIMVITVLRFNAHDSDPVPTREDLKPIGSGPGGDERVCRRRPTPKLQDEKAPRTVMKRTGRIPSSDRSRDRSHNRRGNGPQDRPRKAPLLGDRGNE